MTARHSVKNRFEKSTLALLVGFAAFSLGDVETACAEETSPSASESTRLDRVVVTGTRRVGVDKLEASAPVDVITSETLHNTGVADLANALVKLSPSFSLPSTPTGGFASSLPVGAALRGLSSDQVLVLINGKRRHTGALFTRQTYNGGRGSAAVDLSLIPVSAIARVEVLRDGAAAQYGSDAIAGVINVVLRSNSEGGNINYRYSQFDQGDGQQNQYNAWKGFSLPNDGFLTLALNAGDKKSANNTDPDPRQFYNLVNGAPDPREATSPHRNWAFGSPATNDQYNFLVNGELPLNDDVAIYGFATYAHKNTVGENFFEVPRSTAVLNQSPFFKQRFPDGRIPVNVYKLEDYAGTLGTRWGTVQTGEFDLYANYGRNTVDSYDHNTINPSYGPNSPDSFFTGTRDNSQINAALDYTREIPLDFLAGPLTLSAGVAYRHEQYELDAGDPIAYTRGPLYNPSGVAGVGIPGIYSGITGEDARSISRNVKSLYLDLEASPVEKVELGLALRTEHYSDFGSTSTGKASFRYSFNDALAFRSSFGTGYRAPSLVQLGYSAFSVQTQTINGIPVDVQQRTLIADSAAAALLGGKKLKPEKSENISAGLVWRPLSNASLTFDAYQIDIADRVQLSENLTGAAVTNAFAGTPYANINNAAFFTNVLDTRTRGFEISGDYDWNIGAYGSIDFNLGYTRNKTEITKARDIVTANGTVIPALAIVGRSTQAAIEDGNPKDKLILGANWKIANWNVNLAGRRYGEWKAKVTTPSPTSLDQTFGAQTVFDLDVGYRFDGSLKGLTLNGGAQNFLDSHPDHIYARGQSVTKYSFNSPEGTYGALYYASVGYDF